MRPQRSSIQRIPLTIVGALVTLALRTETGKAGDIFIDPSWAFQEINNILDGNPVTLGKNGQTDAQAGDTVHFAAGVYQLPPSPFQGNSRCPATRSSRKSPGAAWALSIESGKRSLGARLR